MLHKRIIKAGCATPEELEYEEQFFNSAKKAAIYNECHPRTRHWKHCAKRKAIPIYEVNKDTKEIIAEHPNIQSAANSINMAPSNFSYSMLDRPIYKPVRIKNHWFIKQSHYQGWLENKK